MIVADESVERPTARRAAHRAVSAEKPMLVEKDGHIAFKAETDGASGLVTYLDLQGRVMTIPESRRAYITGSGSSYQTNIMCGV